MTHWTPLGSHPSERARNSIPNWVFLGKGLVLVLILVLMLYTRDWMFYNGIALITLGTFELIGLAYDWKNMSLTFKRLEILFYSLIVIFGVYNIFKP